MALGALLAQAEPPLQIREQVRKRPIVGDQREKGAAR